MSSKILYNLNLILIFPFLVSFVLISVSILIIYPTVIASVLLAYSIALWFAYVKYIRAKGEGRSKYVVSVGWISALSLSLLFTVLFNYVDDIHILRQPMFEPTSAKDTLVKLTFFFTFCKISMLIFVLLIFNLSFHLIAKKTIRNDLTLVRKRIILIIIAIITFLASLFVLMYLTYTQLCKALELINSKSNIEILNILDFSYYLSQASEEISAFFKTLNFNFKIILIEIIFFVFFVLYTLENTYHTQNKNNGNNNQILY